MSEQWKLVQMAWFYLLAKTFLSIAKSLNRTVLRFINMTADANGKMTAIKETTREFKEAVERRKRERR